MPLSQEDLSERKDGFLRKEFKVARHGQTENKQNPKLNFPGKSKAAKVEIGKELVSKCLGDFTPDHVNSVNCPERPRGEPGAGRLNLSVSLRSEVQLGVPCLCFEGSSLTHVKQLTRPQHRHRRDHESHPPPKVPLPGSPQGSLDSLPGGGSAWPQRPLLSRLGTASPVTAPGSLTGGPWRRAGAETLPAFSRSPRIHTQHGSQWGREASFPGSWAQTRSPQACTAQL